MTMVCQPDVISSPASHLTFYSIGFEKPSAIQQRAIVPIVQGRDVIAQAQSGTGKTATFSMCALQGVEQATRESQVLILSPTHELALQIQKVIMSIGFHMSIECHACIGGKSVGEDIRRLEAGVQVISGTPGRVYGAQSFSSLLPLWKVLCCVVLCCVVFFVCLLLLLTICPKQIWLDVVIFVQRT